MMMIPLVLGENLTRQVSAILLAKSWMGSSMQWDWCYGRNAWLARAWSPTKHATVKYANAA